MKTNRLILVRRLRVVTGTAALLIATLVSAGAATSEGPVFTAQGFATMEGRGVRTTTGGQGGETVRVTTVEAFVQAVKDDQPRVVEVANDLDFSVLANVRAPTNYPVGRIDIGSNKTVFSRGSSAALRRGTFNTGRSHNIIFRNLRFRDLWVHDPTDKYDRWGWDYLTINRESHHVWIDHCDFEKAYDGMIDITQGSDFVTVSWCVFRDQKKGQLVGHSDSATAAAKDVGRLNVTFHHNWYQDVDERTPRMRFGNAHVFNNYLVNLGGNGVQSTAGAATLVEHCHFETPAPGSRPTVEANNGPAGTLKVVGSVIVNRPGASVAFRERGAETFSFNVPFAGAKPPYAYRLDPVADVPGLITNWAGVGKVELP